MLAVKAAALTLALCLGSAEGYAAGYVPYTYTIAKVDAAAPTTIGALWNTACQDGTNCKIIKYGDAGPTSDTAASSDAAAVDTTNSAFINKVVTLASAADTDLKKAAAPILHSLRMAEMLGLPTWHITAPAVTTAANTKVNLQILAGPEGTKTVTDVTTANTVTNIGAIDGHTCSAVSTPVNNDGVITQDITFPVASASAPTTLLENTLAQVRLRNGVAKNRVWGTKGGTTTTVISVSIVAHGGYSKTAANVNAAVTVAAVGAVDSAAPGVSGTSACTAVNTAVKTNGKITQTITFTSSASLDTAATRPMNLAPSVTALVRPYPTMLLYNTLDKVSQIVGVSRSRVSGTETHSGTTATIVVNILAHDFRTVTTADVISTITVTAMNTRASGTDSQNAVCFLKTSTATAGDVQSAGVKTPTTSGSNIVFDLDAFEGQGVHTDEPAITYMRDRALDRISTLLGVAQSRLSAGAVAAGGTGTAPVKFTVTLVATPTTTTSTTTTTTTTSSTVVTQRTVTVADITAAVTTASIGTVGGLVCSAVGTPTVSGTVITQTVTFPGTVATAPTGFLSSVLDKVSTAANVDRLRVTGTMADGSIVVTASISTVGVTSTTTTAAPSSAATRTISTTDVAAAVTAASVGTVGGLTCSAVGTPTLVGLYIVQTQTFPGTVATAPTGFLNMVLDKVATLSGVTRARVTGTMADGSIVVTSSTCSVASCATGGNKGLSGGEIAGVVVGSIAGAALIGGAIWFFACRK